MPDILPGGIWRYISRFPHSAVVAEQQVGSQQADRWPSLYRGSIAERSYIPVCYKFLRNGEIRAIGNHNSCIGSRFHRTSRSGGHA
jgi:hypothetical protein